MDQEYSAFISHSTKDKAVADQLVADLEASGLTCWIAPRDIRPGADWAEEITRGIESSKCFVLLFSDAANLSDQVHKEVGLAAGARKAIYPVRLEDVPPSNALKYHISGHQWIDALEGLVSEHTDRLRSAIEMGETFGMGRATGEKEVPRIDSPFVVPVAHDGPILPAPRGGEVWEDVVAKELAKKLGELDLGENGREWSTPKTIGWQADGFLILSGSQRIYAIKCDKKDCTKLYDVPRWREKTIHDAFSDLDVFVAGNTFSRRIHSLYSQTRGMVSRPEKFNPDWCRIRPSRQRDKYVTTGLIDGIRSVSLPKRLLGIRDKPHIRYIFRVAETYGTEVIGEWRSPRGLMDDRARIDWSPTDSFISLSDNSQIVAAFASDTRSYDLEPEDVSPNVPNGTRLFLLAWHPIRDIYACAFKRGNEHGFYIVEAATREVLHERTLDRKTSSRSLSWNADGRYLALGGEDEAIQLWDFQRDRATILLGHEGSVEELFFSPDGQRLLSGDHMGRVCVWDPRNPGKPVFKAEGLLAHDYRHRVNGSPWSPDGRMFACFGGPAKIRVYRLT